MKVSRLKVQDLSIEAVDKILYEGIEDTGDRGDCIMVLGSLKAYRYRLPKAVSLYKYGRAPKLLLCGGKIREGEEGNFSEAEMMRRTAVDMGVVDSDILKEEMSMTTKENVLCSLLILEREFKLSNVRKILMVTANYHMKRAILMAETYMPKWINFIPCASDDVSTTRENWYKNEKGYKRAKEEAWKVISYINEGSISDFEI